MTARARVTGAVRRTITPSIRPARLLLALKTAIAAGLAWPIAHFMPGAVDEYSYYAPLGALISMMPTLMGSLRASLQTALGLALGIGLAWAVLESPLPGIVSVPLAVGIGVLLGGLRGLGAGRDYVPIAALFVLVVGGTQAGDYSLGYLTQMGIGMAIGIIVNLAVFPPLRLRDSAREIEALRYKISDNLDGIASALSEVWPPQSTAWFDDVKTLDASLHAAQLIIDDARESRRINPRARWHRHDLQTDFDDLAALSQLGRHTVDLVETISAVIWGDPVQAEFPDELREPLAAALAQTAELMRAWNSRLGEAAALEAARGSMGKLSGSARGWSAADQAGEAAGAVTFTLIRMLAVIESRLDPPTA